jgi:phosphoglycerate dehydrogenase-like enzyme
MIHIHFETRADKPSVFHMTPPLVQAAHKRAKLGRAVRWTVGEDLKVLGWLATAKGLVTGNDIITDKVFPRKTLAEAAPNLRWIHIIGAGIEPLLPLDWLPSQVTLTNNSGVHVQKTGEFATMALLALCSRLPEMLGNQHQARWAPIFTPSIAGKTVLVVGLGDMGGAAAKAAKRLGMRVLGTRRSARPHRHADATLPPSQLHKGLAQADFVLVAAPLTPETRHLIDARAIAAMKTGAGLINVGRAGVVDYAELAKALKSGKLSGAMLDVFDPEPLPASSPLWKVPNLIITPHCSSDDLDHYLPQTLDLAFANVARLRDGKRLKNAVDPATGY